MRQFLKALRDKLYTLKGSSGLRNFSAYRQYRWQPSEPFVLVFTGLVVGLTSGAGVWLFKRMIDAANRVFFTNLGTALNSWGAWTIALIPVLGGLLVGLIVYYLIGEERHHGVAGIMEAAALAGGRLRYKRMPAKAVASAVSIGSGASVGPEDPSVQIGASLGSMFGQWLHLSDERVRSLVAAGCASGIAAAFNAPIAGVFFSLEIILGEISGSAFGIVVLASVISAVFTQAVSGPEPAFHVPAYTFDSPWELPLYVGLGLLAGPISALYIRLLYWAQDIFHDQLKVPRWVKPMVAGLIVGLVGIFLPQVFGVGYDTIGSILNGQTTSFWLLLALMLAKLVLTPVSIGGGFLGGVFAPSLFIGASLGAAYAVGLDWVSPGLNVIPGAYAMVGMAAVLAGAVHAPMTAVILLFEMTNDYRIILPLMFAVVVSMVLSQRLIRESVYTMGLVRKGIRLERGRDVDVLETITVEEIMQPAPLSLADTESVENAAEIFAETHHHGLPVLNARGELVGILTTQELGRLQEKDSSSLKVADICVRDLQVAYPDETMGQALRRMGGRDIGRMPVVSRNEPNRMVGWLRRSDLLRAYDVALVKRTAQRHRIHQVKLGATSGENVRIFEIPVEAGSPCDGHKVKDVAWPSNCLLASLRRSRSVIIPHGDTVLRAGNTLVVLIEGGTEDDVSYLCKATEAGDEV
jgi:chloride channel protein, CIC family